MESIPQKTCPKCKISKPITEFHKNTRNKTDGRTSHCKICNRVDVVAYQHRHPERLQARRKADREKRLEARRQYNRERRRKQRQARVGRVGPRRFVPIPLRASRSHPEYSPAEWDILCTALGGVCLACGAHEGLTIDHVIPLSIGGLNHITNIQPLCGSCNCHKHAKICDYRDPDRLMIALLAVHNHRIDTAPPTM